MDVGSSEHKHRASPPHLAARPLHGNMARTECDLVNTDHRLRDDLRGAEGLSGAVWGTAAGRSGRHLYCCTQTKNFQAFRVTCSDRVHCANAFRMDSSNSPFATKSCACASVSFLAGDLFLVWVDSTTAVCGNIGTRVQTIDF